MPQVTRSARGRRAVLVACLATALPLAAACGVNKGAETDKEHTVLGSAVNGAAGDIKILDASIIPASDVSPAAEVSAAPSASGSAASSPAAAPAAYIDAVITNDGTQPDTFTGVQVQNGTATLVPGSTVQAFTLKPGQELRFADPTTDPGGVLPRIEVTTTSALPPVGALVQATFTFATAGTSAPLMLPVQTTPVTSDTAQPVPGVTGNQTLAPEDETTEPSPTGTP